jgi:ribosomal protein L37E
MKCLECGQECSTPEAMAFHIRKDHTPCDKCGKVGFRLSSGLCMDCSTNKDADDKGVWFNKG